MSSLVGAVDNGTDLFGLGNDVVECGGFCECCELVGDGAETIGDVLGERVSVFLTHGAGPRATVERINEDGDHGGQGPQQSWFEIGVSGSANQRPLEAPLLFVGFLVSHLPVIRDI